MTFEFVAWGAVHPILHCISPRKLYSDPINPTRVVDYTIRLRVEDSAGQTDTQDITVYVYGLY